MKKLSVALALVLWFLPAASAKDKKPKYEEPQALVNFLVIRDYNGKPVRNAGVVMHSVNDRGKQERGGLELKTDAEGKANFNGVPYGKLRVQVLAPGFQTFGGDYEIDQPTMEIKVRLKRPQGQYSIYEDSQAGGKDSGNQAPSDDSKAKPPQ